MTLLLDSGFLYALFDKDDRFHKAVEAVAETLDDLVIVPDVALVEVMFLARRVGGIPAAIRFLEYFEKAAFQLEALQSQDIRRVVKSSIPTPMLGWISLMRVS